MSACGHGGVSCVLVRSGEWSAPDGENDKLGVALGQDRGGHLGGGAAGVGRDPMGLSVDWEGHLTVGIDSCCSCLRG